MDKVTHVAIAWALTLTLHLWGLNAVPALGTVALGTAAWESRQDEGRIEHQQDIVASLLGAIAAEAVWQNAREVERRRRLCYQLTGNTACTRLPRPDTALRRIIVAAPAPNPISP